MSKTLELISQRDASSARNGVAYIFPNEEYIRHHRGAGAIERERDASRAEQGLDTCENRIVFLLAAMFMDEGSRRVSFVFFFSRRSRDAEIERSAAGAESRCYSERGPDWARLAE